MGLGLTVGQLAWTLKHDPDPEAIEHTRRSLGAVNRVLTAHGLSPHDEPETLPFSPDRVRFGSMPYG